MPARFAAIRCPSERGTNRLLSGAFNGEQRAKEDRRHGLKDIYYAENQIIKSLPKLIEKATNRDLSKVSRIIWRKLRPSQPARSGLQEARQGAARREMSRDRGADQRSRRVAGEVADKDVLDAAIVGLAQAVEHYEIARYGTLIAWAESLAMTISSACSTPT